MPTTLGARLGQLASAFKVLFNVVFVLTFLLVPVDWRGALGLARHGSLLEWLLWPALLGLTVFYVLVLADLLPRRRAYVVAVLESSSTALAAALYAFRHGPFDPWKAGIAVFLALTAALFWYALFDS